MSFALIVLTAELIGQTGYPAVARNKTGVTDFAWVQSVSMTDKIYYKRGDTICCSNVSPTDLGAGTSPECDLDDDTSITGQFNSIVAWTANSNEIWGSVNAGTAFRIGQKADNSYEIGWTPRVAIARTGGKFVVTWTSGYHMYGQLYQIGSGSSVTRHSYPFAVTDTSKPTGTVRHYGVSCADNGDFVVNYVRQPASGGYPPWIVPLSPGVIVKGFYMPSSFGNPSQRFAETRVCSSLTSPYYQGSDVASYSDGSFVVAWTYNSDPSGAPTARRYSSSGAVIADTTVAISSGCSYPHPCGTTDGVINSPAMQDVYNVSVAAQRCAPGNYVVGYHIKRGSDSWETYRLKICDDEERTHCSEDVLVMAAADLYPYPDIYKWARVGLDDCGRMVSVFWGMPYGSGWSLYTYLESLCDACETECVSELEPCLEIPLPECADDPLQSVASFTPKPLHAPAQALALAPVPIEPLGTKAAPAKQKQSLERPRAAKLEPKPVSSLTKASKQPSKKAPTRTFALKP